MWKRIQAVIGILCIFTYIFSAAFAGYKIYTGIKEREKMAEKNFSELTEFAARASVLDFLNKDFRDDIKNYLESCSALDAVIIRGTDGRTFAVEKQKDIVSTAGEFPHFNKNLHFYGTPLSKTLNVQGVNTASISAISAKIDFNYLLATLRASLLAILIAFVVSFLSLILDFAGIKTDKSEIAGDRQDDVDNNDVDNDDDDDDDDNEIVDEHHDDEHQDIDNEIFDDTCDIINNETEEKLSNEEFDIPIDNLEKSELMDQEFDISIDDLEKPELSDQDFDIPIDDLEKPELNDQEFDISIDDLEKPELTDQEFDISLDDFPAFAETPFEDVENSDTANNAASDESIINEQIEPIDYSMDINPEDDLVTEEPEPPVSAGGLLEAASKIRNNEQIEDENSFTRILDNELNEAEINNKDLVLMGIEWNNTALEHQQVIQKGKNYFKSGTKVFKKEDVECKSLSFIISETDIDEGFRLAQEFHRQCLEDFSSALVNGLLIGLSCRGERHISASILIKETEHALQQAREDSLRPIVGFKVDTEKHDEFEAESL